MSIRTRLADFVIKTLDPKRAPIGTQISFGSGAGLGGDYAQAYGSNGYVYAATSRIAQAVAEAEPHLYQRRNDDIEEVFSHPLLDVLEHMTYFHTRQEAFELEETYLDLIGEWAMLIFRDGFGIRELWPINPRQLSVVPHPTEYISGYVFHSNDGRTKVPMEKRDVFFIRTPNPNSLYRGQGAIQAIATDIDADRYASLWNKNFFVNGASHGGAIEVPKELSPDAYERLVAQWKQGHQGIANAHKIAILQGGAKWVPPTSALKDMDFPNLRRANRDVVLAAFGMSPHMLGQEETTNRCYDSETETLTKDGWKRYEDITDDDLIGTVNLTTGELVYQKPLHRYQYDYKGPMVSIQNRMNDVLVTPNHVIVGHTTTTPVRKLRNGRQQSPTKGWQLMMASELPDAFRTLKSVEPVDAPDTDKFTIPAVPYVHQNVGNCGEMTVSMDSWLAFLGWTIAEGGILSEEKAPTQYVMTLAQKAEAHVEKIRRCLAEMPFRSSEFAPGKDGCTRWNISNKALITWLRENVGHNCHDKRIPRWCFDLSIRQKRILLDSMIDGDGHRDPTSNEEGCTYHTTSKGLASDVQELAFSLGMRASITVMEPQKDHATGYRVNITSRTVSMVKRRDISEQEYDGKVYCFEVPNHVFVTRRNGKIGIHGNSTAESSEYVFSRWVVLPRLRRIAGKINEFLLPQFPKSEGMWLEFEDPTPENQEFDLQLAKDGFAAGFLTRNEARELVGMDNLGEPGDIFFMGLMAVPQAMSETPLLASPSDAGDTGTGDGEDTASLENVGQDNELFTGQLQEASSIVSDFINGRIPAVVAVELLVAGGIDRERAEAMIAACEGFEPTKPEPKSKGLSPELRWDVFCKRLTPMENRFGTWVRDQFAKQRRETLARVGKSVKVMGEVYGADAYSREMSRGAKEYLRVMLQLSGEAAAAELGTSFSVLNPRVLQWLGVRTEKFGKGVTDTIARDITRELQEAYNNSETIAQVKERIQHVFDVADTRATTIARTEMVGASNQGALEGYKQSGVVEQVEWLAAMDERTRETHAMASGQVVPIGENFKVGGDEMPAPGQGTDPAENINCRCTLLPVVRK